MADASRFPQGTVIDTADITIPRPVGTVVYHTPTGQLYRSLDAAMASYEALTPSSPTQTAMVTGIATSFQLAHNTATVILWDTPTATQDPGENYLPLTGEYQVPTTGFYHVDAFITWEANNTGVSRTLNLQLNNTSGVAIGSGTTVMFYNWFVTPLPTPPAIPWNTISWTGYCTAGKFLRLHAKQDCTANLNIQPLIGTAPFFAVTKVA